MLKTTSTVLNMLVFKKYGQENCRMALAAYQNSIPKESLNPTQLKVYKLLKRFSYFGFTDKLLANRESNYNPPSHNGQPIITTYDKHILNLLTNRIHDLPDVVVDENAPVRVNLLIPTFSIDSISAGFFGVFCVARFIASQGYPVRLVLFDNFYWDEQLFRENLNKFPSFSNLLDEVEIEYIGERKTPLIVSPHDNSVATVWYSAYFAEKIQKTIGKNIPFLYLIQDYESAFFAFSSLNSFAEKSYSMNYNALVSTQPLLSYMLKTESYFSGKRVEYFNNSCSSILPSIDAFKKAKAGRKKRFVFYSRPIVNRNMFELAALSIIRAYEQGVFDDGNEWEFYGMGLGEATVVLNHENGIMITQLPRMSLKDYEESMYTFDLCLSLMSSPHPSIVPFDLAGAGALVVTNSFETKTADFFKPISGNIIVCAPEVQAIADGLAQAVARVNDINKRYIDASDMQYPRTWDGDAVWHQKHVDLMHATFGLK